MNRRSFHCLSAAGLLTPVSSLLRAEASIAALSGITLEGEPFDLKNDRSKAVLVFFWSTESAVCLDKLPELRSNANGWRNKGFQLVGVSVDKSLSALRDYDRVLRSLVPKEERFPLMWRAAQTHRDSFGLVTDVPTSFILDREHRAIKTVRGRIPATLWDDIAEMVLN
jgi:peroxiredoxin